MATRTWSGGSNDNNWGTAGNWDTAPVDGDSVVITGSSDITAGLTTGISIATWTRAEGCTAKIGSASAALTFVNISTAFNDSGRSAWCKVAVTGTAALANINMATGGTTYLGGSGTWTSVLIAGTGGEVQLDSSTIHVTVRNQSPAVTLTISTSGTAITLLENSGKATCRRNLTTYTGEGDDLLTLTDAATMGTANLYKRSRYIHQSSGTITAMNMHPFSNFSVQGSVKNFTITNCTLYENSSFGAPLPTSATTVTTGSGNQITFTNTPTTYGAGAGKLSGSGV